jgi:glutathionyl-hydroquinone reductase
MGEEIPSVNFEKNKNKFKDIRELCKDDKEFDDVVMKVSLLEVIIGQVNQIFMSSLYNEKATALVNSANSSIESLQQSVVDVYIKNSLEVKKLMPIPDIAELSTWVEEIHYDIARQLYSEGFCDAVIYPALQTVTSSVIEFAEEEANNNTEMEEEK